jgi:hypothetical protein
MEFGDDVEMNVVHRLVSVGAVVLENIVRSCAGGREHCAGDSRKNAADSSRTVIGKPVQSFGRFFGDDESVARAQWMDVEESEHLPVFIHLVARYFATKYSCKNRLGHGPNLPSIEPSIGGVSSNQILYDEVPAVEPDIFCG